MRLKGYFYGMDGWFKKRLIAWYQGNSRDLPWRQTRNPYFIWLSEIILQQTQVQQGLPYYLRFIAAFPTVNDLANAPEDEVLKLWQGLGYYSRARNLHQAAKSVVRDRKGVFPSTFTALKELKGVGDYTAAAIASIAFDEPVAVVDGNVYRVLSRVFGIKTPIDSLQGKKEFAQLAQDLLATKSPGTYNQALMEFGALYCKPTQPPCDSCLFKDKCLAYASQLVNQLPVKAKKTKVKSLYFNYLVIVDKNNNTLLKKRAAGAIWEGLYEFVLHASEDALALESSLEWLKKQNKVFTHFDVIKESPLYKHQLSHRTIFARFIVLKLAKAIPKKLDPVGIADLPNYPIARLTEKFLQEHPL